MIRLDKLLLLVAALTASLSAGAAPLGDDEAVVEATDSVAEVTFAEAPVPQQAWALPSTQFGATATQVLGSVAEDTNVAKAGAAALK